MSIDIKPTVSNYVIWFNSIKQQQATKAKPHRHNFSHEWVIFDCVGVYSFISI